MSLSGRRVVLGVSGGIASYKACTVARRLTEAGAAVDVVLTAGGAQFVGPVTFEALTGRPVLTSLWERDRALAHVHLGHDTDLIVVAPATAHLLARAALGLADDILTAILLAARVPILIAPAMNDHMFAHPATQQNLEILRRRGWTVVGPVVGPLAEGPSDQRGRMVEPEVLFAFVERALRASTSRLRDRCVVITAGPTREPLDAVRVITNPSSGKMGYALAEEAFARGARVLLISGPTMLSPPPGVEIRRVRSTDDLQQAVEDALPGADVLVMAAAPADFRSAAPEPHKRPRREGQITLTLTPTADVLETTVDARPPHCVVVGFALELADGTQRAREKLRLKQLDLIVLNYVNEADAGFEVDTNRVTLITPDGETVLDLMPKRAVAQHILDAVEARV